MSQIDDSTTETAPVGALGVGGRGWDHLTQDDAALANAYRRLALAPRSGPLPEMVQELIGLAAAAACSGIDSDAIRSHVRAALAHGATVEQLRETVQLVSIQGIHTVTMGTPIVLQEAEAAALPVPASDRPDVQTVKDEFVRRRGYWSPLWDAVASFDPPFLAAYLDYSSIPWEHGTLEPKVREFIYIAINSVTTHLFPDGLRVHVRNAFAHGATPAEVVTVFEIVAGIGIRSALTALPIIAAEHELLAADSPLQEASHD
ncbi:MAG: carboxymuconolactone decarboxylase family protein [Acidimicrobiia bacterium]